MSYDLFEEVANDMREIAPKNALDDMKMNEAKNSLSKIHQVARIHAVNYLGTLIAKHGRFRTRENIADRYCETCLTRVFSCRGIYFGDEFASECSVAFICDTCYGAIKRGLRGNS